MPWEDVGNSGLAVFRERDRMVAAIELGVQDVKLICGPLRLLLRALQFSELLSHASAAR